MGVIMRVQNNARAAPYTFSHGKSLPLAARYLYLRSYCLSSSSQRPFRIGSSFPQLPQPRREGCLLVVARLSSL